MEAEKRNLSTYSVPSATYAHPIRQILLFEFTGGVIEITELGQTLVSSSSNALRIPGAVHYI